MNAITIIQPYAHLIAIGQKRVENRTWALPRWMLGKRLAIHAGKAKRYGGESVEEIAGYYDIDPADLVFGAVLCVADVIGLAKVTNTGFRTEFRAVWGAVPLWVPNHKHTEGPFSLILDNIRPLPKPLPWSGAQGIWHISDDAIAAAMAGSAPSVSEQEEGSLFEVRP